MNSICIHSISVTSLLACKKGEHFFTGITNETSKGDVQIRCMKTLEVLHTLKYHTDNIFKLK